MRTILVVLASLSFVSPALTNTADVEHAAAVCLERVAAQSMAGGKPFNEKDISRRFVSSCDSQMSALVKAEGLNEALDSIAAYMRLIAAESRGEWTP